MDWITKTCWFDSESTSSFGIFRETRGWFIGLIPDSSLGTLSVSTKQDCVNKVVFPTSAIPANLPIKCLGPPVVPFYPFWGEGSPTKIDKTEKIGYQHILSSLLEDLDI